MPVHDWTRVDAGTFHGFHTAWLTHLSEALNDGRLPKGYYALPEQHGGRLSADVFTPVRPRASRSPGQRLADSLWQTRRQRYSTSGASLPPPGRAGER